MRINWIADNGLINWIADHSNATIAGVVEGMKPITWGTILTTLGLLLWTSIALTFRLMIPSYDYRFDYLTCRHFSRCLAFLSLPTAMVIEYYGLVEKEKRTKLIFTIIIAAIISLASYPMSLYLEYNPFYPP
jgi:uncharacterized membrane protein